jgi:hypothetical protein
MHAILAIKFVSERDRIQPFFSFYSSDLKVGLMDEALLTDK